MFLTDQLLQLFLFYAEKTDDPSANFPRLKWSTVLSKINIFHNTYGQFGIHFLENLHIIGASIQGNFDIFQWNFDEINFKACTLKDFSYKNWSR